MIIAVAVEQDGSVGHSWGRAATVAVADVNDAVIQQWTEVDVAWDVSHDEGTHGSHHARVVRFLKEQRVQVVLAVHVGEGMVRMLGTMGVRLETGVHGDARRAVERASLG